MYFFHPPYNFYIYRYIIDERLNESKTLKKWKREGESDDGKSRQYIKHTYSLNTITLYAYQTSGVLSPNLVDEYRFLLITDNTETAKTKGGAQTDFEDLDTSNYYEVMDYFGLDY